MRSEDEEPAEIDAGELRIVETPLNNRGRKQLDITTEDGRKYTMIFEPKCKICAGGTALQEVVHHLASQGMSYPVILKTITQRYKDSIILSDDPLTTATIRKHLLEHAPLRDAARREILDRRAEKMGREFVERVGSIVTPVAVAETVMQIGYEALVDYDGPIEIKEVLAAAKMVADFNKEDDASGEIARLQQQVTLLIDAVRKNVSQEQMQAIADYINNNRTLGDDSHALTSSEGA